MKNKIVHAAYFNDPNSNPFCGNNSKNPWVSSGVNNVTCDECLVEIKKRNKKCLMDFKKRAKI